MKRITALRVRLACFAIAGMQVCGLAGSAKAVLLWNDPFSLKSQGGDYDTALPLGGQTGGAGTFYAGPWDQPGGDDTVVLPTSLTKPGLLNPSVGGSAGDNDSTACCITSRTFRHFAQPWNGRNKPTGTFYISQLVNFGSSLPGVDDAGNPTDPSAHHRVMEMYNTYDNSTGMGDSTRSLVFGYSQFADIFNNTLSLSVHDLNSNTNVVKPLTGNLQFKDDGMTHCVVLRFDLTGNTGGDAVSVYLDPMGMTEPAVPSAKITGADFAGGALNFLADRISPVTEFSFTGAEVAAKYDDMRVGTTFGDVACMGVPEPATIGMLIMGAVGLVMMRRR
jgi:hypothetical protein